MTFISSMKSFRCPPAGYTIDLSVVRFQAIVWMFLTSWCLAVQADTRVWIAFFLLVDALPKAMSRPNASMTGIVGKRLLKTLGFHPHRADAAPKRFTARVATLLAACVLVLSMMDRTVPALVCSGILFVGSTLEAIFDISIGCKVHTMWWSVFGRPRDPNQF